MYRNLIYLVVALLIGGAAYYFHSAGVPDLIANGADKRGNGVSAIEVFSGVYVCDATSGCENTTKIILSQDTTLDINATIDGQEVSIGQGTWAISGNGSLALSLQNGATELAPFPSIIFAKKVSTLKLTGFSSKRGLFSGMKNPAFTHIREETESTISN
jgi:hypothetical protein